MSPNLLKELEKLEQEKAVEKEPVIEDKPQQPQEPNDFFVRENILKNEPLYAQVEKPQQKETDLKPLNLFSASAFQQTESSNNILLKNKPIEKPAEPTAEPEIEQEPKITEQPEVEEIEVEESEPEKVDEEFFEIKPKNKRKTKLGQFRLKLFTVVFCAIMAVTTGWVITNAVRISNVNKAIETVQTEHSANVIKLKNNIEKLDDLDDNPHESSDLQKVETIITVQPLPLENPTDYQETTNWFDSLCNWISGLFGG